MVLLPVAVPATGRSHSLFSRPRLLLPVRSFLLGRFSFQGLELLGASRQERIRTQDCAIGVSDTFRGSSPPLPISHQLRHSQGLSQTDCAPRGGNLAACERSHTPCGRDSTRLLCPPVHSPQEDRRFPTGPGPVKLEHIHQTHLVQDGNRCVSKTSHSPRRLGDIDRPPRRLLSRLHGGEHEASSEVRVAGESVRVQRSPLRALHRSSYLHGCGERVSSARSSAWNPTEDIPRRLADTCRVVPGMHSTLRRCTAAHNSVGVQCQLPEVRADAEPALPLPRNAIRHSGIHCGALSGQDYGLCGPQRLPASSGGPWFESAISQWLNPQWLNRSVPIQPPQSVVYIYTDASKAGWGAHVLPTSQELAGKWTKEESRLHINLLEMEAVRLALLHLAPSITGKSITVHGDNQTCLFYLKKQGGTRSLALSYKAEEIILWCWKHRITLSVRFVPGKLNAIADQLSRGHQIIATKWTIVHQALQQIWSRWCTTKYSARLPSYVSPVQDGLAFAVDALAIPWKGLQAYAYPPTALISQVLAKYRLERPTLLLVTPYWPTSAWFPELVDLSCEAPLLLALREGQLVQPRSGIPHQRLDRLNLTAWKLCGQDCGHKV